jgi:hypothetical protein
VRSRRRVRLVLLGFLVAAVTAHGSPFASAQQLPAEIDLGDGMSIRRIPVQCPFDISNSCWLWQPVGLSFASLAVLDTATTFARAASGRVVAALPVGGAGFDGLAAPVYARPAGVLYTDDRGATWQQAEWPDPLTRAYAMAFDPSSAIGVAVGEGGAVWSTADEGTTWRRRRGGGSAHFDAVWVRGRTVLIRDRNGALWISPDGGFALRSLADREARVELDGGDVRVITGSRRLRLDRSGALRTE